MGGNVCLFPLSPCNINLALVEHLKTRIAWVLLTFIPIQDGWSPIYLIRHYFGCGQKNNFTYFYFLFLSFFFFLCAKELDLDC